MNKVFLKGRLARDVDLRTTTTGKSVAQVSIAVNRWGKDQGADFIPLVIWGQQAETFARYLGKGREVLVEGRMQVRSYDDKNGNKRYATEVIVENFEFCGSRNDAGNGGGHDGFGGNNNFAGGGHDSFPGNGGAQNNNAPFAANNDTFGSISEDGDIPF